MPTIILQPTDDCNILPAYRYITVRALNGYATTADQYGQELELTINSNTYALFSRKVVGNLSGYNVYEFDLQTLVQDLLTYDLHQPTDTKDKIDSMLKVSGTIYDYYLDGSGLVTKDPTGVAIDDFMVTNTTFGHDDQYAVGSGWHFTMGKYMYSVAGTSFEFLTDKPDGSKVVFGAPEFLPVIIDDSFINGVCIIRYNSAGAAAGVGFYYLTTPAVSGSLITNGRRSLCVGTEQINTTTFAFSSGSMTIVESDTKYEVILGNLTTVLGVPYITTEKKRTYFLDKENCQDGYNLYLVNSLGGVDSIRFNSIAEFDAEVDYSEFTKGLPLPHSKLATGNEKISTTTIQAIKLRQEFDNNSIGQVLELLSSYKVWMYTGYWFTPVTVKDKSLKSSPEDGTTVVEVAIEYANDYLSQRK